jgi:hypothetical protein
MDKISQYREMIKTVLTEQAQFKPVNLPDVQNQLVFDEKNDQYQLLRIGFEGWTRVYYCVFNVDIIDQKVWLQEDTTDAPLVLKLEQAGIPKSDLVLAFHAPVKRTLSGYGI